MKKLFILIIILAIIYLGVKLSIGSPDQSIPEATNQENVSDANSVEGGNSIDSDIAQEEKISADRISTTFTGYGPGKQETGSVQAKESTLVRKGATFSGGVVFDMNTITSELVIERLITHLKSSDFFDATKYPTASFVVTSADDAQIKGDLTMRGITKPVVLPVAFDAQTSTFSTTVRVNMELFGIKQTFADKEFLLKVTIK